MIANEIARMLLAGGSPGTMRPRHREVAAVLLRDDRLRGAPPGRIWIPQAPQAMQPVGSWLVPALTSAAELAAWLGLSGGELDWFADLKSLSASEKLRHYRYRVVQKRAGRVRVIEAPKPRLKALQRRILAEILDHVPAHEAAHGFAKGRCIQTFAAPHAGRRVVLKLDLLDFFPSISGVRVQALFRAIGYPEPVADLLGGLCTSAAPPDIPMRELYGHPHLPQGAPTSPALANRIAYRLDCRLAGLAASAGAAAYTRYADDLAFSGDDDFASRTGRFAAHVATIVQEEGLAVNFRKTRVMKQGVRQQLAGLVTNSRVNVPRDDWDALKATLTNCARHGAAGQNRARHAAFQEHLAGRVAFVESVNAAKGARLREIYLRIRWGD